MKELELKFKEGVLGFVYDFEDGVIGVIREKLSEEVLGLMGDVLEDGCVFSDIEMVSEWFVYDIGMSREELEEELGRVVDVI